MRIYVSAKTARIIYFLMLTCTSFYRLDGQDSLVNKTKLFESDEVLDITLSGHIRELLNDRSDRAQYHQIELIYRKPNSSLVTVETKIRTRGSFRRLKENCYYPPLLIQFAKTGQTDSSLFKDQDRLKLVMPCQDDEYVIREWLAYKIYNLLTPKSFRVRLVKLRLEDNLKGKMYSPFYGILIENENEMSKRNGCSLTEKRMRPEQTDTNSFLIMAVFQYLAGNTDWSVQFLQNIRLITTDPNAAPIPVPYDFDMCGIVNAPYAVPHEELKLISVQDRLYRGYCIPDMKRFDGVIGLFNRLRNKIYGLYTDCPLLYPGYIKNTKAFLDEFYTTINSTRAAEQEFHVPCDKNGPGNIIIKGLREH
jgi:hypothetical protein